MSAVNAIVRFSRDKRGYEHYYLMSPPRRGQARRRVLYWFRTPPSVKVGRGPFDPDVRRFIESQNPGLTFDWTSLLNFTVPSADVERWRERRRERAQARQADARDEQQDDLEAVEPEVGAGSPPSDLAPQASVPAGGRSPDIGDATQASGEVSPQTTEGLAPAGRRRRRRRRRHRSDDTRSAPVESGAAAEPQAPGQPADGFEPGPADD